MTILTCNLFILSLTLYLIGRGGLSSSICTTCRRYVRVYNNKIDGFTITFFHLITKQLTLQSLPQIDCSYEQGPELLG